MAIYIILLILLASFSIFELINIRFKNQKIIFIILCLTLVCVSGFRYGLETDYWHYYYIFNGSLKASNLEIAFMLLNKIVYSLTHNFNIFCIIVAILSMGLKGWIFDKMKYPFTMLLCYYLRFYVLFELNAIRQGLAITFIILAYMSFDKKQIKKYILFSIIAILFHSSAVIVLLTPLVYRLKLSAKWIMIVYVLAIVFRLAFFDRAITYLQQFSSIINGSSNGVIRGTQYIINSGDKMQPVGITNYVRIILPGISLYYLQKNIKKEWYYNLYFIGSIMNIMFLGLDTIGFRLASNFYVVECLILSAVLSANTGILKFRKFKWKQATFLGIVAFCDIWSFIATLASSTTLIPYTTFFFH